MVDLVVNVLEQGLIFGLMSLGVYITYKILDFPDLSVDGTIVLGGACVSVLLVNGVNPMFATLLAGMSGLIAGFITGVLHVHLKITNLLSGILVMIGLYSVNLRIMNAPNIPLFSQETLFKMFEHKLITLLVIVLLVKILLDVFLGTKLGMLIKTTGDNPTLVTTLGEDIGKMKIIGLMLSNGLVALSGALLAQYQRFADINSGTGTIIFGLAAVIIGFSLFKPLMKFLKPTTFVLLGAFSFKLIYALTINLGLNASDFKLISAVIVIILLALNKKKYAFKIKKVSIFKMNKGGVKC